MNSAQRVDLIPFNWLLMELIWKLALLIMMSACCDGIGMMACFLEGPLVVDYIFLPLGGSLLSVALWILMIFLLGKAGKASLSLRMFEAGDEACTYNLVEFLFVFLSFKCFVTSSSCFWERCGGMGGEHFSTKLFLLLLLFGGPDSANIVPKRGFVHRI